MSPRAAPTRASDVMRRLRRMADPARAAGLQRFFRTGPGEYGAGDRFLGLHVPQIRGLAREFSSLPLGEVEALLAVEWHEVRLLALIILSDAYRRADAKTRERIYRVYLRRRRRVNNWDLVDLSAPNIVGAHLFERSRAPLYDLARSRSLWDRRIAIVATHYFIRRGDFDDTLRIAELLERDDHDLIHKAVGWMLREVGKKNESVLLRFLDRHAASLPRTALRYSIERLKPAARARYMKTPRQSTTR